MCEIACVSHRSAVFRQPAPLTRRIVSIARRAGLLTPGYKRRSSCLPIRSRTVALTLHQKQMSCSPVTVARETAPESHRLPYSACTLLQATRGEQYFDGISICTGDGRCQMLLFGSPICRDAIYRVRPCPRSRPPMPTLASAHAHARVRPCPRSRPPMPTPTRTR